MNNKDTLFFVGLMVFVVLFGAGMFYTGAAAHDSGNVSISGTAHEYNVTLVITNQNYLASVGQNQPAYFVLENGKLMSSAQIYLPGNALIQMTIINYDSGPGSVSSAYSKVTGTTNNTEYVFNDTSVNGTSVQGHWVSTVSNQDLAHTFTIASINLNIMVPSHSTVIADFHTPDSGVLSWQCEVDCGTGASGWGGAMETAGYMKGEVVIN